MDTIIFKILSWEEWSQAIVKRITEEFKFSNIDIKDLIFAPRLDPENPKEFCVKFMFDDIYEDRVFVRHYTDKDCYWFINCDSTCLLYRPKLT